jgi:hypothetical protein
VQEKLNDGRNQATSKVFYFLTRGISQIEMAAVATVHFLEMAAITSVVLAFTAREALDPRNPERRCGRRRQ